MGFLLTLLAVFVVYELFIVLLNVHLHFKLRKRALPILTDEEITSSYWFRFWRLFYYLLWSFYAYHGSNVKEFAVKPKLENGEPAPGQLFIGRHSTHNWDIFMGVYDFYEVTGRPLRILLHRSLCYQLPLLQYCGAVSGERRIAVALLKAGHCACVAPGGGEEALYGHENVRKLYWQTARGVPRRGFAEVVKQSGCAVHAVYTKNVEEMRLNLVFLLWNFLRLGTVFHWLLAHLPYPTNVLLNFLGLTAWIWTATLFGICFPVHARLCVGPQIPIKHNEQTALEIVAQVKVAVEDLLAKEAPPQSHWNAFKARWFPSA